MLVYSNRFDGSAALRNIKPVRYDPLADHLKKYQDRKWAIFPLQPRDKLPITRDPKRYGESWISAASDKKIIDKWFDEHPNANVGLATGQISGVFVLDVDGPDGEESLYKLQQRHGWLPNTAEVQTGNGRHLYWQSIPGIPCTVNAVAKGLDIRGDEGYVVAPPSIHENGRQYTWTRDDPVLKPPQWLLDKAMTAGV